ncbi:hypothetical protein [Subtercola sp. YIM 133946]
MTPADSPAPRRRTRVGRVLWPIAWVLLALASATVTYLLLVIIGR